MKKLDNILKHIDTRIISGLADVQVTGLSVDSRKVAPGFLFGALVGWKQDGHQYITNAIENGAVVVVCQQLPEEIVPGVTYIEVENSSLAFGLLAAAFYGHPSRHMKVIGVTGTNGKTTIATLLHQLFTALGYTCGLISTVKNIVGTEASQADFTTPDAAQLQNLLAQMHEAGCSHVFMEVSSHALHQHRVAGLHFAGGIFSNITHDHLDYHKTFEEYIRVKKSFFDALPVSAFAITNADEKRGRVMLQNTAAKQFSYALRSPADFKGKIIENHLTGLVMEMNGREVHFRMIGEFNAYNLLAVFGAAVCLGEVEEDILEKLSELRGAEGRFDYTISTADRIIGIVDYAHTPDALMNVLATIQKLRSSNENVITVVGCGGDRDKTKRPLMAAVACGYSTRAILTSDNPRTEDPLAILEDMQEGMKSEYKRKSLVIADRREAIKTAVALAEAGDIILVAGKGHENYQDIHGVKHHFDDKEELNKIFELLQK